MKNSVRFENLLSSFNVFLFVLQYITGLKYPDTQADTNCVKT